LRGGVTLDGALSEPLLKSIFDPHSIGHDGALVLIGKRVTQFAAHLPLSADMEQLANRGTRHAAALGLAERTDALCLVVSEERGAISIAKNGALRQLSDSAALRSELEAFKRATGAGDASANWSSGLFLNIRLKGAALGVALAMWFLFVHESVLEYRSFLVPVQTTGLPQGLTLERGTPRNVKIIVSGARRAFYFVGSNHFQVVLKLFGFEAGVSEATVTASDLSLPDGVEFVNVFPRNVQLTISAKH
jgi:diadenylate cyclase